MLFNIKLSKNDKNILTINLESVILALHQIIDVALLYYIGVCGGFYERE